MMIMMITMMTTTTITIIITDETDADDVVVGFTLRSGFLISLGICCGFDTSGG